MTALEKFRNKSDADLLVTYAELYMRCAAIPRRELIEQRNYAYQQLMKRLSND